MILNLIIKYLITESMTAGDAQHTTQCFFRVNRYLVDKISKTNN